MEKRAAKMSGSRPNPRNGSVPTHGHMSSSATARRPVPRNSNLENEKSFRRSPTYHGRSSQTQKTWDWEASSKLKNNTSVTMRRPKTQPELLNRDQWKCAAWTKNRVNDEALGASKLLVNVTVARSLGPLRELLSKDATVEDAIKATLVLYDKEGRDKVKDLGSRTFFLCSKEAANKSVHGGDAAATARSSISSCGREIQSISRITEPWYNKLMSCLLSSP